MAYNQQYSPFGFNPSAPSMPFFPQQPYQSPAPVQSQPQSNVSWAYVNGLEGARAQIVQPGQTSWMMDNNDSIIYVKAVDSMGTASLKAFRLTEISNTAATQSHDADYVKREELDEIRKKLEMIESTFGGLNA